MNRVTEKLRKSSGNEDDHTLGTLAQKQEQGMEDAGQSVGQPPRRRGGASTAEGTAGTDIRDRQQGQIAGTNNKLRQWRSVRQILAR